MDRSLSHTLCPIFGRCPSYCLRRWAVLSSRLAVCWMLRAMRALGVFWVAFRGVSGQVEIDLLALLLERVVY